MACLTSLLMKILGPSASSSFLLWLLGKIFS